MWKKFNFFKIFYSINRNKYSDEIFHLGGQTYSLQKLNGQQIEELLSIQKLVYPDFEPWTRENFLNELRNRRSLYVGVYRLGRLIGFSGINVENTTEVHITNLSILPEYQNLGIGSFLIEKMIDFSYQENFLVLSLEVDENNFKAIDLYQKFDFKKIRYIRNYYPGNHSAVIMEKLL